MPPRRDQRPTNVRYYRQNREREIARVVARQRATTAFLRDLRNRPCADCNRAFEPYQMDFDHRDPATKSFQLTSSRAMLTSRAVLEAEVAKCDVVCAICHRLRTRRWHRLRLATRTLSVAPPTQRHRLIWRRQARVLNAMRRVPCSDCGRRYPPCAMDFDHRAGEAKVAVVTEVIGRSGLARIFAEVAKCDIVCANCHRRRTYERRSERE